MPSNRFETKAWEMMGSPTIAATAKEIANQKRAIKELGMKLATKDMASKIKQIADISIREARRQGLRRGW